MGNLKKTLGSGSILEVTMSPFEVGHRLLQAVMAELETIQLSIGFKGATLSDLFGTGIGDEALNTIKNVLARLIASKVITETLWECMKRATYNGVVITRDTFESIEAREDFLEVVKEVLVFNLTPFLRSLKSILKDASQKVGSSPRSE